MPVTEQATSARLPNQAVQSRVRDGEERPSTHAGEGRSFVSSPPRIRCRNCDQPFYPRSNYLEQVFCSRRCARAWQQLPARLRLV